MESYPNKKIIISIIVIVSLVILTSLGLGLWAVISGTSPSSLESNDGELIISGMYGETIPFSEIKSIELIYKKPLISWRTNGFAMGAKKKGYFANSDGEKFKLFIDTPKLPWILITKQNELKIYYSSNLGDNQRIFEGLIKTLPNNTYNTSLH
ncbi:hypothetical protein LVD13_05040 [Flavobacteriaceae bacterium D16]|nr:hypothetical protein [Flavobacteriaceae bacterium D16]